MEQIQIQSGIDLSLIPDDKFKTFAVSVLLYRPLDRAEVTKNALVASLMQRETASFDDATALEREMERLYGARLYAHTRRLGEAQILRVGVEALADAVLPEGETVFDGAIQLLLEVLLHCGKNGTFSPDQVKLEKENLKNYIEGQKNDKRAYSLQRCQEEMCRGEAFGVSPLGYIEDLAELDGETLYAHYETILRESPIDVIVTGNFEADTAKSVIGDALRTLTPREKKYPKTWNKSDVGDVKYVTDRMDVTQGKLCLGFRSGVAAESRDYFALWVCSTAYGGSTISKLFVNVREKLSLCYYASSYCDRLKGLMMVQSGIEFENYQKVYDEIMIQLRAMRSGDISAEELDAAKKTIIGALRGRYDSLGAIEDFYTTQLLLGTNETIEGQIMAVSGVTREQATACAQQLKLDTVYFLRDKEVPA